MKGFFRSRSFKVLTAAAVVMCAAIIYTSVLSGGGLSSGTSSLVGLFTTPMQWLVSLGGESLGSLTANAKEVKELQKELDELQKELDKKNQELSDYYTVKKQNDELKEYLGLREQHTDWEFVDATVVARDTNELFYGLTINKGSLAGIQPGDPVITSSGLVGRVSKVSTTYAKVETLYHPEVSVSVLDVRTEEIGILTGDKKYADRGLIQMKYLDTKTAVAADDLIVTTGMGGVYPADLVIGTVKEVITSDIDISKIAVIRPAAAIKNTTSVMVITSFTGQGETMEDVSK